MDGIENHRNDRVSIDHDSDLYVADAEALIGKVVARIEAKEYELTIVFEDGSNLMVRGHTLQDSCLTVKVEIKDDEPSYTRAEIITAMDRQSIGNQSIRDVMGVLGEIR